MPRQSPTIVAAFIAATALLLAGQAIAASPQLSLQEDRYIRGTADYGTQNDHFEVHPNVPFGRWEEQRDAYADEPDVGSAEAHANQISGTIDSLGYIGMRGSAWGGWAGDPSGTCSVNTHARFTFRLLTCSIYTLQTTIGLGTCAGFNCAGISLEGPSGVIFEQTEEGSQEIIRERLPAGDYVLEGHTQGTSGEGYFDAGVFEANWNCYTCPWSLILEQPKDKKVPPGSDPNLVASADVPTDHMTYQWRLNLVPLVDDGRITGSQTTMLTIHNVAAADEGYYDVVFTDSSDPNNVIVEPSQPAHLQLDAVTGVGDVGSPRAFSISPASPNPFARATTFRYETARPMRVTMAIYNVTGARVRTLVDEQVSGAHTITWDGALQSGTRAPAGIYYLRVEAGDVRENRKIVLLR